MIIINKFMSFINLANDFMWGPVALVFLAIIGIYLTIGTKFIHIKKFGHILKRTIFNLEEESLNNEAEGVLTSSQSLFTSLASVIGMGSIVGVASAVILGGPGALLWMWVAAVIGMIIKYAEIILIIKYRDKKENGEYVGGPALYVKEGLGLPVVGEVIVLLMVLVCLSSTMIQSNVIVENINNLLPSNGLNPAVFSIINVVLVGLVLLGGIKRIGSVAEKLVPFMSIFYLLAGIIVIGANYQNIIPSIKLIFQGFLSPVAISGGLMGYSVKEALQYGIARGFFVSGAGQAVFTVSHAPAKVNNPVEQAIFGVTEVFLVTIICTITGLTILTSGILEPSANAAILVTKAFAETKPILGLFVGISTILFSYSTVIGLGYVGEAQLSTITSSGNARIYRFIFLLFTFIGGTGGLQSIWDVTDFFLAVVMFINLIVLILMSREIFEISNGYWSDYDKSLNKK